MIRYLFIAALLCAANIAHAQTSAQVQAVAQAAAGCPTDGAAVITANPFTFRVDYQSSCTSAQESAGNAAVTAAASNLAAATTCQATVAGGLAIASTGTPSLNATYATDGAAQLNITAENVSILVNGTFTNGQVTKAWLDMNGGAHTFSTSQFKTFATAVGSFVDQAISAIATLSQGQNATCPAASMTIP